MFFCFSILDTEYAEQRDSRGDGVPNVVDAYRRLTSLFFCTTLKFGSSGDVSGDAFAQQNKKKVKMKKRTLCVAIAAMFFVFVAAASQVAGAKDQDWRFELAESGKDRFALTAEIINGGASSRTDTGADVDWSDFSGLAFTLAEGVPWWWSDAAPSVSIGWSFWGTSDIVESNGSVAIAGPTHKRLRTVKGEFLEAGVEIPLFSSKVFRRRADRWGEPWRPYFLVAYLDGRAGVTTQKGSDVPYNEVNPADISKRTVHAHGMKYGFALSFNETLSFVLSVRVIKAPLGIVKDFSLTSLGLQANFY